MTVLRYNLALVSRHWEVYNFWLESVDQLFYDTAVPARVALRDAKAKHPRLLGLSVTAFDWDERSQMKNEVKRILNMVE